MTQPWAALRRKLAAAPVTGTFQKLPALEVVELLASRLDFAIVDLEHSQLDELEARRLIRHARALGFPVLVRLSVPDRERVNRLLEAGAAGIQLSSVRTVAAVEELRSALRYAPAGERSISLTQPAGGYGAVGLRDYLATEGDGPLLVAQIETATTDDPLGAIAAAGPDVIFIGPMDLAVDLGHDAERLAGRVAEIAEVAADAGIPLGGTALPGTPLRYSVVGSDVGMLRAGIDTALREGTPHAR